VNVLVLGATGLLGNAVFRSMSKTSDVNVKGTIRRETAHGLFASEHAGRLTVVEDIENSDQLGRLFDLVRPDVVVIASRPGARRPPIRCDRYRSTQCCRSGCRTYAGFPEAG
jgi:dTDP-4-dehydrorhamnose reductase